MIKDYYGTNLIITILLVLFIGALSLNYSEENYNITIAILDFNFSNNLQKAPAKAISQKLRDLFATETKHIILDKWLIDTMASAQASLQLLECREESCLLAIGNLLMADIVIDGSVEFKNNRYEIKINTVATKKNTMLPTLHYVVRDTNEVALTSAFSDVVDKIVSEIKFNTLSSTQNDAMNSTTSNTKKRGIKKKVLITTIVAVIGGVTGGGYFLYRHNKKDQVGLGTPIEIPLTELPKHPDKISNILF